MKTKLQSEAATHGSWRITSPLTVVAVYQFMIERLENLGVRRKLKWMEQELRKGYRNTSAEKKDSVKRSLSARVLHPVVSSEILGASAQNCHTI